jgi:AraC-like DNA-binding protein
MPDADKLVRTLPVLPPAELALSYVRTFDRHRCDLAGIGVSEQRDARAYRWNNRQRPAGVLLQLTLAGEGWFEAGGRGHALPTGTAFVVELPSATRYALPRGSPYWRFAWAMMAGDAATDHARRIVAEHGHVLRLGPASTPATLLLDLHRRVTDRTAGGTDELSVNIEVHRLLLELERAVRTPTAAPPAEVAQVLRLIDERYGDPDLNVAALADTAGYSRYHFSRVFKQHTGLSPYQRLLRVRIRRALQLLTTTDLPVKQVALRVGFRDVSWFCSAFRKQMRATPATVRRQRRRLPSDEAITL